MKQWDAEQIKAAILANRKFSNTDDAGGQDNQKRLKNYRLEEIINTANHDPSYGYVLVPMIGQTMEFRMPYLWQRFHTKKLKDLAPKLLSNPRLAGNKAMKLMYPDGQTQKMYLCPASLSHLLPVDHGIEHINGICPLCEAGAAGFTFELYSFLGGQLKKGSGKNVTAVQTPTLVSVMQEGMEGLIQKLFSPDNQACPILIFKAENGKVELTTVGPDSNPYKSFLGTFGPDTILKDDKAVFARSVMSPWKLRPVLTDPDLYKSWIEVYEVAAQEALKLGQNGQNGHTSSASDLV